MLKAQAIRVTKRCTCDVCGEPVERRRLKRHQRSTACRAVAAAAAVEARLAKSAPEPEPELDAATPTPTPTPTSRRALPQAAATKPLPPRGRADMPAADAARPTLRQFRAFLENQSGLKQKSVEAHFLWMRRLLHVAERAGEAGDTGGGDDARRFLDAACDQDALTALWHQARDAYGHGVSSLLKVPAVAGEALNFLEVRGLARSHDECRRVGAQRRNLKGVRRRIRRDEVAAARAPLQGRRVEDLEAAGQWLSAEDLQRRVLLPADAEWRRLLERAAECRARGRRLGSPDARFAAGFVALAVCFGATAVRTGTLAAVTAAQARALADTGSVTVERFKTSATYGLLTIAAPGQWVRDVVREYLDEVRPLVAGGGGGGSGDGPFLLNSAGAAEANLGTRVSELTRRYSGRSIHLNRLRQIMETFSLDHFSGETREAVSRAQAHSSVTARRHYQKKRAAEAAAASRAAYDGALGTDAAMDGARRKRPGDGDGGATAAKRRRVDDNATHEHE